MRSRLDRLLDSIHPARTLDATSGRVDEAINTFTMDTAVIADWEAFRVCLVRFLHHVETRVLGLRSETAGDTKFDLHWARCRRLLMREYGLNGEKAAFEMARTGKEGGLYGVLRRIGRRMSGRFADTEIMARVETYWDALSAHEQLAAGEEYLEKYGHLLPSELTEDSAMRIRANLPKVLREHPQLMQRLARIGRT